ncbi:MAG: four helix bundle protein [Thermomicrobiales bacterium]
MRDFRKIKVWDRAHQLVLAVYEATSTFPREEMFGLTSQIRRASASIPANIAEGCGRGSTAELARFCRISLGSANELEYHFLLAKDLRMLEPASYDRLDADLAEVKRMLVVYVDRLLENSKS